MHTQGKRTVLCYTTESIFPGEEVKGGTYTWMGFTDKLRNKSHFTLEVYERVEIARLTLLGLSATQAFLRAIT